MAVVFLKILSYVNKNLSPKSLNLNFLFTSEVEHLNVLFVISFLLLLKFLVVWCERIFIEIVVLLVVFILTMVLLYLLNVSFLYKVCALMLLLFCAGSVILFRVCCVIVIGEIACFFIFKAGVKQAQVVWRRSWLHLNLLEWVSAHFKLKSLFCFVW